MIMTQTPEKEEHEWIELEELKRKIEAGIEEAGKGELVSGDEFFAELIEKHQTL